MGYFRFRRVFNLFPGLRLNLSKSGVSASLGVKGAHYTVSPKGTRTTVGLPGSGLFYTDYHSYSKSSAAPPPVPSAGGWFKRIFFPAAAIGSQAAIAATTEGGQNSISVATESGRDRIATMTELETFKAETRTSFQQAQAKDKVSATNNLLTGDTMSKMIEAFESMASKIEESLKLETPLVLLSQKVAFDA